MPQRALATKIMTCLLLLAAALLASSIAWAQTTYIPDHERTPGAINPDITQENIVQTVCGGGHPSDPRNLWPEPVDGRWPASVKDQLEASVCRQVCVMEG